MYRTILPLLRDIHINKSLCSIQIDVIHYRLIPYVDSAMNVSCNCSSTRINVIHYQLIPYVDKCFVNTADADM